MSQEEVVLSFGWDILSRMILGQHRLEENESLNSIVQSGDTNRFIL